MPEKAYKMIHMISEKSRKEIDRIMARVRPWAEVLEEYDRTGVWPLRKVRKNFTLESRTARRIEEMAKERGISQSGLLDELVQGK